MNIFSNHPLFYFLVHKLKPGDINVVAAFGDSVTAGNGADADNLLEVVLNARGHSWR